MCDHLDVSKGSAVHRFSALLAVSALALAGCTATPSPTVTAPDEVGLLAAADLTGRDVTGIIDHLDVLPVNVRPEDLSAIVYSDQLVLSTPDEEISMDLPEDVVYISVAPFVTSTHDCTYHDLTTCLGEMRNAHIEVMITDDDTGAVLIEETTTTFDNGFIGYWLPRDISGIITITQGEFTGSAPFSTGADAITCITDLHLQSPALQRL